MWIVIPSTCSPSAPGTGASTSDSPRDLTPAQAERLASCVTLSGKHSPPRSWRTAWRRKAWLKLLSGATCEPSTADAGVGLWIASLADTRANRSALRASGREKLTRGTCGPRWLESLRRLSPASCFSRTSEGTYRSGSTMWPVTFSEWATELRRDFSARQKLARRIGGSGCSSLAWPTATSGDAKASGAHGYQTSKRNAGVTLTDAIERGVMWLTPSASEDAAGVSDAMQPMLTHQAEQHWQTLATDSFRSRGGERKDEMGLDQQARTFPSSLPDPEPAASGSGSSASGPTSRPRLNPAFVEWLMGLPTGFTDFAPLGTELSLWRLRMRSALSGLVWRHEA